MSTLCGLTKDNSGVKALTTIQHGQTIIVEDALGCFHFTTKVQDSEMATEYMAQVYIDNIFADLNETHRHFSNVA